MAAWDALAKSADMPLARLLGGEPHPIPAYASYFMNGVAGAEKDAEEALAAGFKAFKIKIGYPDLATDIQAIREVRRVSGDDVVLMVDAYHEFSHPREMMEAIVRALKPDGRVVIIEYRGDDPRVGKPPHHKMTEAQLIKEMAAVGLRWQETKAFLPQQHFMVFERLINRR